MLKKKMMKEKVPEVIGSLICHSSYKSKDWKLRNLFSRAIFSVFVLLQSSREENQGRNDKSTLNCTHLTSSALTTTILQIVNQPNISLNTVFHYKQYYMMQLSICPAFNSSSVIDCDQM